MKLDSRKLELNPSTNGLLYGLMVVGLLSLSAGFVMNPARAWNAYLISHTLFMGLGIGALFFLVIHYLAFAGWNVALRRITESFASYLPVAALLHLVLFFGLGKIYPWTNHELMHNDHLLHGKVGYFATPFYVARALVFLAVVVFFSWKIIRNSTTQDDAGGRELLDKQKPLSALFLVLFAPLFTVFSVDLLKSLDPKWFSTMYGVYVFVGFVQASVAVTIITIRLLQRKGYLGSITADHFHDLGKYLFGFSIFWAYIGVSQYLLIWYANLPEETGFYMLREKNGWAWVSLAVPALRFLLPFLLLLPRMAKRTPAYLEKVALVVFVGAWLDIFWLVIPYFSPTQVSFSFWDLGAFLFFASVFAACVRRFLSRHQTVPTKDPFLHETMHHHVM